MSVAELGARYNTVQGISHVERVIYEVEWIR
jgi:hypothetical protein